jgi:CRISPR-associated protein Cmr5
MVNPQTIGKIATRSQRDMKLALDLVAEVEQRYKNSQPDKTKGRYQALCQEFPVMVRTMGLCQTLAFCEAKKGSEEGLAEAHGLLLDHVGKILGTDALLSMVQNASVVEYMHQTRRVLDAWTYFKRFSKSVLSVDKP